MQGRGVVSEYGKGSVWMESRERTGGEQRKGEDANRRVVQTLICPDVYFAGSVPREPRFWLLRTTPFSARGYGAVLRSPRTNDAEQGGP